jgi:3-phenylpropionate/trans-cinnamate dioxygenase ferredoxin subunit
LNEEEVYRMNAFVPVCTVDEIANNDMKSFDVNGIKILIANVSGSFYAIHNECTHECGYLDEGDLEDDTVVCPIHFARFSVVTGTVIEGPAESNAPTFEVKVEDNKVYVRKP